MSTLKGTPALQAVGTYILYLLVPIDTILKCSHMSVYDKKLDMDKQSSLLLGLSGLTNLGSTIATSIANRRAQERQIQHDKDMAELELSLNKDMFDYTSNFNSWANNKGQMIEAGLNTALMYGGTSPVTGDTSGASASSSDVKVPTDFRSSFRSLDPAEYLANSIAEKNGRAMRANAESEAALNRQRTLESMAKTLEQQRQTKYNKLLETTLFDIQKQTLLNMGAENANIRSEIAARDAITPSQVALNYQKVGESEANVRHLNQLAKLTAEQVKTQPLVRQQLTYDMERIQAATTNLGANTAGLQESIKKSQLGRIMQEFGLNAQTLKGWQRNNDVYKSIWTTQMSAATTALMQSGFSEFEAVNAVLYYTAENPSEITPGLVGAVSGYFAKGLMEPSPATMPKFGFK